MCMCMIAYYVNFFFLSLSLSLLLFASEDASVGYFTAFALHGENNGHWNAAAAAACSAMNEGPTNVCLSTHSLTRSLAG